MTRLKVCLVTSGGGHLFHLQALESWWRNHDRFWVAPQTADVVSMLQGEKIYHSYHPVTRNVKNLIRNAFLALKILFKERPNLIISTGAGEAIPFYWLGRILGAKLVFIEVFDCFEEPTWTGKLVYPVTHTFLLQHEKQARFFPKGHYLGPLFKELA